MHPRAPKLLEDIRNAADFVKTVTGGAIMDDLVPLLREVQALLDGTANDKRGVT